MPKKAQHGPLSISVPSEVKCMAEAHDLYGSLPWKDLFEERNDCVYELD